jgi:hypothetical protein
MNQFSQISLQDNLSETAIKIIIESHLEMFNIHESL